MLASRQTPREDSEWRSGCHPIHISFLFSINPGEYLVYTSYGVCGLWHLFSYDFAWGGVGLVSQQVSLVVWAETTGYRMTTRPL